MTEVTLNGAPTALQVRIALDLKENGPSLAVEIAKRLNLSTRGVTSALCWGRGEGRFDDGSVATKYPEGIAYTPPAYPIRWTLKEAI